MAKRVRLQHWKDKGMARFDQWIEELIALAIYEQIAYRSGLCMDKYNELWDSFIQNTVH